MSEDRDTGYHDVVDVRQVAKVHIPPCHQNQGICQTRLSELVKKLQEEEVECYHVYPLGGLFKDHFEKFVEESHFTILHKCPAFWWKVRNLPSANYRTAPKEKLICVSLSERESIHNEYISGKFGKEDTRESYEAFFQDLHVADISNETGLTAFVCNLVENLPNTRSRTAATAKTDNEHLAAGVQKRENGACSAAAQTAARARFSSVYDFNQPLDLCESLDYPFIGEGQILEQVPDIFGHTNRGLDVFARADCLAVDTQPVCTYETSTYRTDFHFYGTFFEPSNPMHNFYFHGKRCANCASRSRSKI